MIEIQKILIPTDFSEYSQYPLKYAVALAERFKAKLYVAHVWEHAIVTAPTETCPTEIWMEGEKAEKEKLSQLTQELRTKGIDAEPVFMSGAANTEIVEAAKDLDVDLITLATHGRTGATAFLLCLDKRLSKTSGTVPELGKTLQIFPHLVIDQQTRRLFVLSSFFGEPK